MSAMADQTDSTTKRPSAGQDADQGESKKAAVVPGSSDAHEVNRAVLGSPVIIKSGVRVEDLGSSRALTDGQSFGPRVVILLLSVVGQHAPVQSRSTIKSMTGYMCNPCLLYTSPSPRDQRGSRMPSSA